MDPRRPTARHALPQQQPSTLFPSTLTDPVRPPDSSSISLLLTQTTALVINTALPTGPVSSVPSSDPNAPSPTPSSSSSSSSSLPLGALIGIIVGGVAALLSLIVALYLCRRRRGRRRQHGPKGTRLHSQTSFGDPNPRAPSPSFYDRAPHGDDDSDSVFGRIFRATPSMRTTTEATHQTSSATAYYTGAEDDPPPVPFHPYASSGLPLSSPDATSPSPTSYPPYPSPLPSPFSPTKFSPGRSYAPSLGASSYFSARSYRTHDTGTSASLMRDDRSEVQLVPMMKQMDFPRPPPIAGADAARVRQRQHEMKLEADREKERERNTVYGRGSEPSRPQQQAMQRLLSALELSTERLPSVRAFGRPTPSPITPEGGRI